MKSWFKRGLYPKAEQFSDWIDSFWHKEDDKIPVASVENLPTLLNDKYARTDGEELERKHRELEGEFREHETANANEFTSVYDGIKELRSTDAQLLADLETVHADITGLQDVDREVKADIAGLHETDAGLQTSLTNAHGDIGTIREMLKGGATLAEAKAALVALGANYKDLHAVASTLKTFLQSNDTADATINTWREIERFLQGITDTASLTALLSALETKITEAYNAAITAAVGAEQARAEAAELQVSKKVDKEKERAEAAEAALGGRITQTRAEFVQADTEIRQAIAAVRQTMLGILAESAGRVIPLVMNVAPPHKITLGNPVAQYIKAELLPSFAVQNVLFLGDGKAVDVEPDGAVTVLGLGKSRVHVIPTENTALHKTVEIEVVRPSMLAETGGGLLMTAGSNILLT